MKSTEKINPPLHDKLQVIAQNYYEYNMMEKNICLFVIKLVDVRDENQKNELFAKMHQDVKMRTDNFYKDVNAILMDALRQVYAPNARTYSQMGSPLQSYGQGTGIQPYADKQIEELKKRQAQAKPPGTK